MYEIRRVTPLLMEQIMDTHEMGRFYAHKKDSWVACEHLPKCTSVAAFDNEASCVEWLRRYDDKGPEDFDKSGIMRIFDHDKIYEITGRDLESDKEVFIIMKNGIEWLKNHSRNFTKEQYHEITDLYWMLNSLNEEYLNGGVDHD